MTGPVLRMVERMVCVDCERHTAKSVAGWVCVHPSFSLGARFLGWHETDDAPAWCPERVTP